MLSTGLAAAGVIGGGDDTPKDPKAAPAKDPKAACEPVDEKKSPKDEPTYDSPKDAPKDDCDKPKDMTTPPPAPPPPAPPTAVPPVRSAPPQPTPPTATPPRPRPRPAARLVVSKSGPARPVSGGRARFIIKVHNRGRGVARGVIVSDILPRGFFVRVLERRARSTGRWVRVRPQLSGGRLVARVGSIGPRRTTTFRVTLGIRRGVLGRRCNVAVANGANVPRAIARTCMRLRPPPRPKAPPRVTG